MSQNHRQVAFLALRDIHKKGILADIALDKYLRKTELIRADKRLITELVYGCVRRQRTLDAIINQLGKKAAHQQPPDLRLILHLGLYQIGFLSQVPAAAAVDTTVDLAKQNGFSGLAGFVNGLLRQYHRCVLAGSSGVQFYPFSLPENGVERLGILQSYPDWIVQLWLEQLGLAEAEQLCEWLNQSPTIDLRVNGLKTSLEIVEAALQAAGILVSRMPHLPQALRLTGSIGNIQNLPGFVEGWWTVQDSSAQLVSYLLDPQPGEVIIDACAAPGGKTTHLAELMGDQGIIFACDKTPSRLKKLTENVERLQLKSIQVCPGDSRNFPQFMESANRVLLDAPCSGLGTLHRRADSRWRHTPENIQELSQIQGELLEETARWVQPGGILVYATCTLHPQENEQVISGFLKQNLNWKIDPVLPLPELPFLTQDGWIKVWPQRYNMDGFFMVRLKRD